MSRPALPDALLEAIRYEHWLRFYFLDVPEESDENTGIDNLTAFLRVPASACEASRRDISLNGARDAVFRHVALIAGADPADPAFGERLFQLVSDPDFRRGLDAFHAWVQDLANGETRMREENEEGAPSFAAWEAAFRTWEAEKAVRHVTSIGSFANKESA